MAAKAAVAIAGRLDKIGANVMPVVPADDAGITQRRTPRIRSLSLAVEHLVQFEPIIG